MAAQKRSFWKFSAYDSNTCKTFPTYWVSICDHTIPHHFSSHSLSPVQTQFKYYPKIYIDCSVLSSLAEIQLFVLLFLLYFISAIAFYPSCSSVTGHNWHTLSSMNSTIFFIFIFWYFPLCNLQILLRHCFFFIPLPDCVQQFGVSFNFMANISISQISRDLNLIVFYFFGF